MLGNFIVVNVIQLVQLTTQYGYSIFDHFILKCMIFLSRINIYIENKCCDFHFNVSAVYLLNVLLWSPNENKLTLCELFVKAREKI